MKNTSLTIILIIFCGIISSSFTSCESLMGDFLDKAPGVDVTEDTIFSSKVEAETFLTSIYHYGIHSNLGYGPSDQIVNHDPTLSSGASDESETCAAWYVTQSWNTASVSPDNTEDFRFPTRFIAIRKVTVLLDRIDGVSDATFSQAYKNQLKAEAKFIRALNYFEMFKRYGGVPIIDHRIQLNENLNIQRSSVEATVNFIVKDCDEAIPDLPINQTGILKGRVTKGAALALKSKALLYAASPLFNTATPYLDFGSNNNLICYGNYDVERWKKAAAAAKDVLDWAPLAGCDLINDKGVDKNYKYSWEVYDNKEIILAEKSKASLGSYTWPWSAISPPTIYNGNAGQNGISPILNFVKKYEKKDGTPQTWDPVGGKDLQAKMGELDYRFAQTIAYNMSSWNTQFPQVQIYEGGNQVKTCFGGFWLHKLYPDKISKTVWTLVPNSTLFQLNEIYLNYAEAMNEAYGPDADNGYGLTARQAVNIIRSRSGQPPITDGDIKERIRNERAIELAFDNHRFWDIRRWMIAEQDGVMQGDMHGIKIYKIANSTEFRYEVYVFEKRTFLRKMYLHPFGTTEINKGYLIQNPGY